MSSQKVEQTREEKLEAIIHYIEKRIWNQCALFKAYDTIKEEQADPDSRPESKEYWASFYSGQIERIQRILSEHQDKFNAKLIQCIDMISLELYDNAVQNAETGVLIHPVIDGVLLEDLSIYLFKTEKNKRSMNIRFVKFTDAGMRLLLRFV